MADNDSNIIKPVGSLQNIANLAPTRRREEGKRRNNWHGQEGEESEQEINGQVEEEEDLDDVLVENQALPNRAGNGEDDRNTIDYRA